MGNLTDYQKQNFKRTFGNGKSIGPFQGIYMYLQLSANIINFEPNIYFLNEQFMQR